MLLAYGRRPDIEFIELANVVMNETGIALQPGRWMVDKIPARKSFQVSRRLLLLALDSGLCPDMGSWRRVQEMGASRNGKISYAHDSSF